MAEVQKTTQSGELTQRFIEFVMMQAQNAALFLGQIPNPQTGKAEINLEVARMFIDQLAMIQEKTRNNLTTDETTVLRNALSSLQMAFVEASQGKSGGFSAASEPSDEEEKETPPPRPPEQPNESSVQPAASDSESKKKFTKSYGA
ncbi:MAG: DUF1844 domain-containing protein [Chthoniobacterales bacterium]|nr:DUF1844 domain-containing protein [Chthoniobacterales bacterium]